MEKGKINSVEDVEAKEAVEKMIETVPGVKTMEQIQKETDMKAEENAKISDLKKQVEKHAEVNNTEAEINAKEAKIDKKIEEMIAMQMNEKMSIGEKIKNLFDGSIPVRMALAHMKENRPLFIQGYRDLLDNNQEAEAKEFLKMYAEDPKGYVVRQNSGLKKASTYSVDGGAPNGNQ